MQPDQDFQPPLRWWSQAWRYVVSIAIGAVVWAPVAEAQAEQWPLLAAMVFLVLVARPLVAWVDISIRHMVLIPGATCLIRWQSHWHVVRQSWPFFQNDFAGSIANRVMQTAHALRDSVMASIRAVWYIGAYGVIACTLVWLVAQVRFTSRLRTLAYELPAPAVTGPVNPSPALGIDDTVVQLV